METARPDTPQPVPAPFGALLRRYRLAAGLTQEELAERAGLSVQGLSALENGRRQAPYRHTVALLAQALGLDEAQRAAFEAARVRRREPAAMLPAATTPTSGGRPSRALLPLIGRERDEATVAHLLQRAEVRWLTLTGPGGVGKTRLALQAAPGLHRAFADGWVFVDLAPLRNPARVLATIAAIVGVEETGAQPLLGSLVAFLHGKQQRMPSGYRRTGWRSGNVGRCCRRAIGTPANR